MKSLSWVKIVALWAVTAAFLSMAGDGLAATKKIYWTDVDQGTIKRANPNGTLVETLVTGVSNVRGIAVDTASGKIYYAGNGKIQRANLNGTETEDVVTGLANPHALALDVSAGKIYWTDPNPDEIRRADLNGLNSNIEVIVDTTVLDSPSHGLALDPAAAKVYWADNGLPKIIGRANVNGGLNSNVESVVSGLTHPGSVSLDTVASKVYWTDTVDQKIRRADFTGMNVQELVVTTGHPINIAIDARGGKMYWSEDIRIRRANLDGSNITDIVTTGLGSAQFIALDIPPTVNVAIDIKPGSDPNSINLRSAGVIPVAILSSPSFDATTIDPDTVTLAGARVSLVGKSNRFLCSEQDVNGDGRLDLVCHVETAQFFIEPGETVAVLEAETFDGVQVRGEDSVRIVQN